MEMGLLRLVNAARLAPLEEILAELSGAAPPRPAPPAPDTVKSKADVRPPAPPLTSSAAGDVTVATAAAAASVVASVIRATTAEASESRSAASPVPGSMPSVIARAAETLGGGGLDATQVAALKSAVLSQQKFLGELVEHASRWELDGSEIRLYFPTESRALAEMLQGREPMEKLRTIANRVLGRQLRVCVKLEAGPVLGSAVRAGQTARELRTRFEQDPIVRAMLERFGGQISDVKLRGEE